MQQVEGFSAERRRAIFARAEKNTLLKFNIDAAKQGGIMSADFGNFLIDQIKSLPWHLALLLSLIMLAVILGSITKIFEFLSKIWDGFCSFVKFFLAALKGHSAQKDFINRRKQFLRVLSSDLSTISKAEAWNDQHFTDLEAEVEIEGKYYDGPWMRFIKTASSGRRREPSLMKAIEKSSERNLLLLGDPGAGKSVALRHLAIQIIESSLRSIRDDAKIPLYVNLREFAPPEKRSLTIADVKEFVIDNVRRGDADTAEYVRSNWDDFQKRGVWFFLFDSFDEIPVVLHAAAGDSAVLECGKVIQMFMAGLGSCRGVLASREYKRPSAIDWPTLRILSLDENRQEELVRRTFLSRDQKEISLRAMALSSSATYKNPLFLTLLCRYVKQNGMGPKNEHDLLMEHVKHLSRRDSAYIERRWGLNSSKILRGAAEVAKLFACSPSLGLAPTIDEIFAEFAAEGNGLSKQDINSLIEAMTYVKIGRMDVSNQEVYVRRFAFSHRRYQECLYAEYLSANIDRVDVSSLLIDSRWREYVVALLQVGSSDAAKHLVIKAAELIDQRIADIKYAKVEFYGYKFSAFLWDDDRLEHLFSLFLEAMRYNPNGPWQPLEQVVESLFMPLWNKGDFFDRYKIVQYAALGDKARLVERLEFSIESDISILEERAVDACRFSPMPSNVLAAWIRRRVSMRVVSSVNRQDFLRWEAMASQLPSSYKMALPIARAKKLAASKMLTKFFTFPFLFTYKATDKVFDSIGLSLNESRSKVKFDSNVVLSVASSWLCMAAATFAAFFREIPNSNFVAAPFFACFLLYISVVLSRIFFLDFPEKIGVQEVSARFRGVLWWLKSTAVFFMFTSLLMLLPVAILYCIFKWFEFHSGNEFKYSFLISFSGYFLASLVFMLVLKRMHSNRCLLIAKRLRIGEIRMPVVKALRMAKDGYELMETSRVLCADSRSERDIRAGITYLTGLQKHINRSISSASTKKVGVKDILRVDGSISIFLEKIVSIKDGKQH